MIQAACEGPYFLEIRRTLQAPRERVYDSWVDAEVLPLWFAPTAEHAVIVHALEARVGGAYHLEIRHSSGKRHVVRGTYRELDRPDKLSFTWRWDEDTAGPDTLVTVTLTARGDATDLVLRHERFADEAAAREHNKGWTGCLDRMVATI